MELHKIMQRLGESRNATDAGIKTASVVKKAQNDTDALRGALHNALVTPNREKTAAIIAPQTTPQGDLLKMAEDLTNAEEQAMQKQASLLGAAMCDGFMERFAQYEEAAGQVAPSTKTAAAATHDRALEMIKTAAQDPEFQKFANANPELVKEAFDLGYQQTYGQLVKEAQDQFQQGYDDQMSQIHKTATDVYKTAAYTINDVLRKAS